MDQPNRKRGRRKGASRLNPADDQILIKVASIVEAESIPASTAMHRFGFLLESAGLRRLQRKWKVRRDWYLAEARNQVAARAVAARAAQARTYPSFADMQRIAAQVEAVSRALSPSVLRAAERVAAISDHFSRITGRRYGATLAALESPAFKALQMYGGTGSRESLQHFAQITGAARQLQGTIDNSVAALYGGHLGLLDKLKK